MLSIPYPVRIWEKKSVSPFKWNIHLLLVMQRTECNFGAAMSNAPTLAAVPRQRAVI